MIEQLRERLLTERKSLLSQLANGACQDYASYRAVSAQFVMLDQVIEMIDEIVTADADFDEVIGKEDS